MSKKEDQPNPPVKRFRFFRFFLKGLLFLFLFFTLLILAGNIYLQSNRTKILSELEQLNKGTISFDKMDLTWFHDFPDATLSLTNLVVHDSLFQEHQIPLIKAGEINAALSLEELRDKTISIKSIELQDGEFRIFKNIDGYNNLLSLIPNRERIDSSQSGNIKIKTQGLGVSIHDFDFHFIDKIRTTHVHGSIDELTTQLDLNKNGTYADLDFSIHLDELAFKKKKGSFAADSNLKGKTKVELKDSILIIEPFDLLLDDEEFLTEGKIHFGDNYHSFLVFESDKTNYSKSIRVLPDRLYKLLEPYKITQPFYSKTKIKGTFQPGDVPVVTIDFDIKNNELGVLDYAFEEVNFKGRFINKIYDDERKWEEGHQRVRIKVGELNAAHKQLNINARNALVSFTKETGPRINAQANIEGPTAAIHDWFQNDKFFFEKGRFNLQAIVNGPLNNFNQLALESEAYLDLKNFNVAYMPANVSFPFEELSLEKKIGNAKFSIASSTFKQGHNYTMDGGIKNLNALLIKLANERASSEVNLIADKLSWTDFIDLFGKHGYLRNKSPKSDLEKKKNMKETLMGIQYNFQPRIRTAIDTLQYFDLLEFRELTTGIHFENEHTLVLEKTKFNYEGGEVDFKAKMNIGMEVITPFEFELHTMNLDLNKLLPPLKYFNIKLLKNMESHSKDADVSILHKGIIDDEKGLLPNTSTGEISFRIDNGKTISGKIEYTSDQTDHGDHVHDNAFVTTGIEVEGNPKVFNKFFKTEDFFFDKGRFYAHFNYKGEVATFQELLEKGYADLTIENSEVYYRAADITFPLTRIGLDLHEDDATYHFFLRSDTLQQEIQFRGKLEHVSSLLFENTGKHLHATVETYSPKTKWEQFLKIFAPERETEKTQESKGPNALKNTLKGIAKDFDPKIHVRMDTFIYSDKLMVNELSTGIHFLDSNILVLEQTDFRFHDGSVSMNGKIDLNKNGSIPFSSNFQTSDLDAAKLLESLDYLGFTVLRDLEKLEGRTTMNLDISGEMEENKKGLISEKTKGVLDFNIQDVVLQGFEPLDEIAERLKRKKRFKELRFAPLSSTFIIDGKNMEIPLMEIQSNAFHMFVEGTLSQGDETNLWVSIPYDNLKKTDISTIPEKIGYPATGNKVHIEIFTNKDGENTYKIHSTKRKFYKQRGILEQYKQERIERRKWKQENRKKKKLAKKQNK